MKQTLPAAYNLHIKFALFCTPYCLQHGIEIFSDYSLLLAVTVLYSLEIEKKPKKQSDVILIFFKFHKTGSEQQQ